MAPALSSTLALILVRVFFRRLSGVCGIGWGPGDGVSSLQPLAQIDVGAALGAERLVPVGGRFAADGTVSHIPPPSAARPSATRAVPPHWSSCHRFPSRTLPPGPEWHSRLPCPRLRGFPNSARSAP